MGGKYFISKSKVDRINEELLENFSIEPDRYVYTFQIKEKHKVRNMLTYNKAKEYGVSLRNIHGQIAVMFEENFCERNENSYAYHKGIRCKDAIAPHMKSNYFIKLDIHHFFESITLENFFRIYKDRFNKKWTRILNGCFYKSSLSIGFITSPILSDFFMSKFDEYITNYILEHKELHYSRYCDDILLSSESDSDSTLLDLFNVVKDEICNFGLQLNEKKTKMIKLDFNSHNSLSFLGLNISKIDEINNKVTISKNYILFLLYLIEKNEKYENKCKGLLDEINSRVAYLAYNSPISFQKFQKKHINKFGLSYNFIPKKPMNRYYSNKADEIYNFDEYSKDFVIDIHKKIVNPNNGEVLSYNGIELVKYKGNSKIVNIPPFIDSIGDNAFNLYPYCNVEKIILNNKVRYIGAHAFENCNNLESIVLPNSLRYLGDSAFKNCKNLKTINIPKKLITINPETFYSSGLDSVSFSSGVKEIGFNAFRNCLDLKSIDMPDTIESLDIYAFADCKLLNEIHFSSNLLSIPENCFFGCSSLSNIDFGNSILSIEASAFANCSLLKSLYIPSNVVNISNMAFFNCNCLEKINVDKSNLVYDSRDNCNAIIDTKLNKLIISTKKTKIPHDIEIIGAYSFKESLIKSLDNLNNLKEIEDFAFKDCVLLKKVVLPNTLVSIGAHAFENCLSIKNISLPNSLEVLNESVFANCSNLNKIDFSNSLRKIRKKALYCTSIEKINFPDSLEEIEYKAFSNCYNIKKLYIPKSVRKIYPYAFSGCSKNLVSIEVDGLNPYYDSRNNCNALIETKTCNLLVGCKNTILPDDLIEISSSAFAYCHELQFIEIPKGLISIGNNAFIECDSLIAVDFNCVQRIGASAFKKCTSLITINLPSSIVEIGSHCFEDCLLLKDIILPSSLVYSDKTIYKNCKNVENIYISSTYNDTGITKNNTLSASERPFDFLYDCKNNIKVIKVDSNNPYYDSRDNCNAIVDSNTNSLIFACKNSTIPKSVTSIGQFAFSETDIKTIEFPENIKFVKENAFSDCKKLEKIVFSNEKVDFSYYIFKGCTSLKEVILPDNMSEIPAGMFSECEKLEKIIFSKKLEKIGDLAFSSTNISDIQLPNTLKTIGCGVFSDCKKLNNIQLPSSLLSIGNNTFAGCISLKSIDIPKKIKKIESNLFLNCSSLENIAFSKSIRKIDERAFKGCKSLREFEIPKYVKSISKSLFEDCSSLTNVIFHNEVKTIESFAFAGCSKLKNITLPNSLKEISQYAFYGCSSLEKIILPNMIERIKSKTFAECTILKEILIPDSVKYIEDNAFTNSSISEIYIPKNIISWDNTAYDGCLIKSIRVSKNNLFDKIDNILVESKTKCVVKGIKNSIIPTGVLSVGKHSFENLKDLKNIVIPDSVVCIEDNAFTNCTNLEKIVLSKSLLSIGCEAFKNCLSLRDIIFPESLISINKHAFMDCISINNIHIPERLINISTSSFYNCSNSITSISVDKDNKYYDSRNNCNALIETASNTLILGCSNTVFDKSIEVIGSYSFYKNNKINNLILPEGIRKIDSHAFWDCENIVKIEIPSTVIKLEKSIWNYSSNLQYIKVSENNPTYKGKNYIEEIDSRVLLLGCVNTIIPDNIIEIANYAFCNNISLNKILIPKNIVKINSFAFSGCTKLQNIIIEKENPYYDSRDNCNAILKTKENILFFGCANTTIPESTRKIAPFAFNKIIDLKNIFIPKNVHAIHKKSFFECENVESIVVDNDNKYYDSRDNSNAIFRKNNDIPFMICKNTLKKYYDLYTNTIEHVSYIVKDLLNNFGSDKNEKKYILNGYVASINNTSILDYEYEAREMGDSIHITKKWDENLIFNQKNNCFELSDDPFKDFGIEMSLSDDDLPF